MNVSVHMCECVFLCVNVCVNLCPCVSMCFVYVLCLFECAYENACVSLCVCACELISWMRPPAENTFFLSEVTTHVDEQE